MSTVLETNITEVPLIGRGKVRDLYDLGEHLLIVTTDRISAFDVILPSGIRDKGKVLTKVSAFWFSMMSDIVPNHLVSTDVNDLPENLSAHRDELRDRIMIVRKARPLPIECIVRGYLAGSGWKDYQKNGAVCGIELPEGMQESEKFPEPLFTPSTKAEEGHDENISFAEAERLCGPEVAGRVRDLSIAIYSKARDYAAGRGIIIADTKFEFGALADGSIIWIDECLTPDSSRFWPADEYSPGRGQKSFDKQFVRDYLETLDWDKTPPGPVLPDEIVEKTRARYVEVVERLTGAPFETDGSEK